MTDTPKRSPSLTDQTVRFSELVAGYDEPAQTCPLSDEETCAATCEFIRSVRAAAITALGRSVEGA